MRLLTTVLDRFKIAEFVPTREGQKAFENAQRDIITLYPEISHLETDFVSNTGSFVDSPLRIAVNPGQIYALEAMLTFKSSSTGKGIGLAFKLPTGAEISGMYWHNATATGMQGTSQTATGAISGITTASYVANNNVPLIGKWIVKANTAEGEVILQVRSDTGSDTITLIGGLCVLRLSQVV
jgi:hypothetical protein